MIRVYELKTNTQTYIGVEVNPRADIVSKHREYKFNPALTKELDKGFELCILHEVKTLKTAEQLENYYRGKV